MSFVPLIYWITDHAMLQAMPDIEHTLLQFISVMNFSVVACTIDLYP